MGIVYNTFFLNAALIIWKYTLLSNYIANSLLKGKKKIENKNKELLMQTLDEEQILK